MSKEEQMIVVERKPTHPGCILREEFMSDYDISVAQLAEMLGVSRQSVNELVHERRALSAGMAQRLARLFGTTARYWMNLQQNVLLWESLQDDNLDLSAIKPLSA